MFILLHNESGVIEMAKNETAHLVSMANDIAANLSFHADADARIADHIRRFWAPRMRSLLLAYAAGNGEGLAPEIHAALERLRGGNSGIDGGS
jgi:formate dehydrogenase subunit delta